MTTSELGPSSAWGPGAPAGAGSGPGAPAHARAVFARLGRNKNPKSQTLLKIHLRRALIHVETCGSTGRAVLDSCGEEGDLFFLLDFLGKTVAYDLEALRLLLRGMCELLVRHEDATPLSLSKRELATMAAQSETGTDGV